MEVNKHINFLKRRGFLIKEESQLELPITFDRVEPKVKGSTKVSEPKVDKPEVVEPLELDLDIDKVDVSDTKGGYINIEGLCNRSKVFGVKNVNTKDSIWHLNGEDLYCTLLKNIDPNKYEVIRKRINIIYEFFKPSNDNRTKFHNLIKLVLTNNYMSINTLLLLADHLESLEGDDDSDEVKVAINRLKTADVPLESEEELDKLLRQIKTIEYSKYEESFDGEFFSLVRTGLSIDYKDTNDDTFTNQLHDLIITNTPEDKMVEILFSKILEKNQNLNDFIKADLMTNVPMYSNIGGRETPLIEKDQFIEVKKLDFEGDSYLSEFFSIYKNSKIGSWANNQRYFDIYNKSIDKLYVLIKEHSWGKDVLSAISRNFAGIIYKDGDVDRFIPSSEIDLYWSNAGQRKCESERRLTIRYKVKSGKVDSYIFSHDDDTMDHEVVPVKSSERIMCSPHVDYGPNKETKYPGRINLGEATVNDKRGGEWDRDSTQGKMIRTKGGTKELDDSFDWVSQHMDTIPDDPKILALIQHLGVSEVIGEDFDDDVGGWYGNHTAMNLQNGEEWVVGDSTSMGNALYEYFDNYIDDVGYDELGVDLANFVDVSDLWVSQFCEEEADNSIDDMSDYEILDTFDDYDIMADIEELADKEIEIQKEIDKLNDTLAGLTQALQRMETENQDYTQYGYSEPPHDEETMDNAREFVEEKFGQRGELEGKLGYDLPDEKENLIDTLREQAKSDSVDDCERCMGDPVDCIVNEKGWYRTAGEAIDAFGWDIDKESLIDYFSQDGYGSMSGYDGEYHEEEIDGHIYIMIRVN